MNLANFRLPTKTGYLFASSCVMYDILLRDSNISQILVFIRLQIHLQAMLISFLEKNFTFNI